MSLTCGSNFDHKQQIYIRILIVRDFGSNSNAKYTFELKLYVRDYKV